MITKLVTRWKLFWDKRWKQLLLLLIVVIIALAFLPGLLLEWFLVYKTEVKPAEVVFIGVGLGSSLDTIVELQQTGIVERIVVVYDEKRLIERNGNPVSLHELTVRQLVEKGVPPDAVQSVQWNVDSKVDGQLRLRSWILENGVKSYLKFVSRYHSAYAQMIHEDTFPEGDVELVMITSESNRVWRKQILNLQNTILRMLYWYVVSAGQLEAKIQAIGLGWDREWKTQYSLT